MLKLSVTSSLRPGYISGYEAIRRIAAVMAGSGVKHKEAGWAGFWFIAETDGKLIIANDILHKIKKLPYLKITSIASCFVRKHQILATCCITDRIVPEYDITLIESLLNNNSCLLTVKSLEMQRVIVSQTGRNKISSMLMLIQ
ncbi:hypothetical protein TherJR_2234 [Thermincola potens JR]|uniref:Uncharacterized protein n=2 Tax=Thermincola TaxID=278993 RepID=D5X9H3_THEPJ|nr:hypothetical protein TherJR_2234 [Thermincola potens JR]